VAITLCQYRTAASRCLSVLIITNAKGLFSQPATLARSSGNLSRHTGQLVFQ